MSSEDAPSVRNARAAAAAARFSAIRIPHGPQNALVAGLDGLRLEVLETRKQRAETGLKLPMPVCSTIAELGVGKTIGAERLEKRHMPIDPDDLRRPVIIATLDTTGQQISIPQAILVALKKRNATHASKPALAWERARKALLEHDVQLIVFDEMNRAARRPTMGEVIGGDLMDLLRDGEAGIAFLGTTEAKKVLNRVPALKDRMKSPVVMKPLEWYDHDERADFVGFLDELDEAMLDRGLVTAKAGLADYIGDEIDREGHEQDVFDDNLGDDDDRRSGEVDAAADADGKDTAKLLWEVCRGRLRPLCLLIDEAVRLIHYDNEELVITHEVLAQAVENHSRENEIVSYNPFMGENPA